MKKVLFAIRFYSFWEENHYYFKIVLDTIQAWLRSAMK